MRVSWAEPDARENRLRRHRPERFCGQVDIRLIDPAGDEADLRDAVACVRGTFREYYGDFPLPGRQRLRFWSSQGYQYTATSYGAYSAEDGRVLGVVGIGADLHVNRDLLEVMLAVPAGPDGAGADARVVAALLDRTLEHAREQGRTRLGVFVAGTLSGERYAAVRAGKLVFTSVRSVLDLTAVDRGRFAAWSAPSPANEGYELVRWVDHCPEELADAYVVAMAAMDDAPMEQADWEHPTHGLARLRGQEEHSVRYGVRRHVTAAVTADGEIGGYTMFTAYPEEPGGLDIWDTGVARAHRGHGLGRRLKADATLWLLREYPDAGYLHTYNNHGNEHMLAINRELGYRPAEREEVFEFTA
jgi:GNAT superfamily N-acetyltransferase